MTPNRLIAGALLVSGLSACGGADKPAETTVTETRVVETAPAAEPAPQPVADAPAATAPATVTLASLTGDAAAGEKVFGQCKTCHVAEKGVNRVGPSLWGVVGRHSGIAPGYKYSAANLKSNVVWNEATMYKYLEAPMKFMPGTKMSFAGLKKPQDRADVIAYLKTKA